MAKQGKLQVERQQELAAIWGDNKKSNKKGGGQNIIDGGAEMMDDNAGSDGGSTVFSGSDMSSTEMRRQKKPRNSVTKGDKKRKDAKKKDTKKKKKKEYRLHCFTGPGVSKNDVREVFEDYEPKVELRLTQKGNALTKSRYAILTFANKALALHAVLKLDGTNQRDTIGVKQLKLGMMLSREQSKLVRQLKKRRGVKKPHEIEFDIGEQEL